MQRNSNQKQQKLKTVYIPISGGLGNQLFQISGALSLGSHQVKIIKCLGRPRYIKNEPALFQYELPSQVQWLNCNKNHSSIRKVFRFLQALSSSKKKIHQNKVIRIILLTISSLILSNHFHHFLWPRISNGTGFDEKLESRFGNFLVGEFQVISMQST